MVEDKFWIEFFTTCSIHVDTILYNWMSDLDCTTFLFSNFPRQKSNSYLQQIYADMQSL